MPFDPVDPKQSFPELEHGMLRYWQEEDTFKRSIHERKGAESFSFFDGPPFATGLPHYGHLLAGTIKDVIPRYQTMRGKSVQRRFGWDCHGLPVEYEIEKEHNINSKAEIEAMGVDTFNALCRGAVQRYSEEWRNTVQRMGRWVDMDWDYRTMDPDYMESIWWVFKSLYDKGLIYEGYKPMHLCPRCVTPLSNFEVTQGYKDVTDQSVIARFELVDEPETYLLAWTTTPWTLPGNLFLAINSDISYVKVSYEGDTYILAKDLVENVFEKKEHEIIGDIDAKELLGKTYAPLFPYFADDYKDSAFKIVEGDFVTTDDGTGIVHIAPGFGDDDYQVGKREGVEMLQHVKQDGTFVEAVTDFAGEHVKPIDDPAKTDRKVIAHLKAEGKVFESKSYKHSYPHCWRCDSPLLNYATSSWFVAVEKIKKDMIAANKETEWVPNHLRDGRFGKWLDGARDWAISRNRYWGTPLPIWRNLDTGAIEVIGSRDELMQKAPDRFTKITVVRHAESQGNVDQIYQGEVPGTDLTANGKKQAEARAAAIQENPIPVDVIYHSPLARTTQTAEAIQKTTNASINVDDRLREVGFGQYEGKHVDFSDLAFTKARRAHKMEKNQIESIYHFEGMETWDEIEKRCRSLLDEILEKHKGEHIVIVTHADLVMNFTHIFTGQDRKKIVHQPYPDLAGARTFYWDHERNAQMDLHKETVDDVQWGDNMQRIPDVLDCWFESGSMPYAQSHFPFEGQDATNGPANFPANFIAEGLDQTRGWFYTLMVLSSALYKKPAFEHCIVNGIVLAEDGKKMSKSLKNYPDPKEVIEKYGADAIRFALMHSPAVRAEDLRFSEKIVEEKLRNVILPLWNTYSFFVTYANAANWEAPKDFALEHAMQSDNVLDQWILIKTQDLVNRMTDEFESYDLSATAEHLADSIDGLTNWYVRLNRRRFAGKDEGQAEALDTLYRVLMTISQLLAPFCPFITESIYLNLVGDENGSIHLTDWPAQKTLSAKESTTLHQMEDTRTIVRLGLKMRSKEKIKIRQPLQSVTFALPPKDDVPVLLETIKEELNVKEVHQEKDASTLADVIVNVDARKVGPRLGGKVQEIIAAAKAGNFEEKDGKILVLDETLTSDEARIEYRGKDGQEAECDHGIVVSLDTNMTDELIQEGFARDIIRTVQRLRKEQGLEFTDDIVLSVEGADETMQTFAKMIEEETRSTLKNNDGDAHDVRIEEKLVTIRFEKV